MWANRLVTIRPFGLNSEKPCGVADFNLFTPLGQIETLSRLPQTIMVVNQW